MSEVSCRATDAILGYLERRGVDLDEFVSGIQFDKKVSLEDLRNPDARVSWDTFVRLTRTVVAKYPEKELAAEVIANSLDKSFVIFKIISQLRGFIFDTRFFYKQVLPRIGLLNFAHLSYSFEDKDDSTYQLKGEFPAEFEDQPWFWELTLEIMRQGPRLWGLPDSLVEMTVGDHHAVYKIVPPPHTSLLKRIGSFFTSLLAGRRIAGILAEQEKLIKGQYLKLIQSEAELRRAKGQLEEGLWRQTYRLEQATVETHQEVTKRRQVARELHDSEKRLRVLFDSIDALVMLLDLDGRCLAVNGYIRQYKMSPESLVGKFVREVLPAGSADAIQHLIDECCSTKEVRRTELELQTPIGPVWASINVSPIFDDDDDELAGMAYVSQTIGHIKLYEAQLEKARREAEIANRAKSVFLANMSHEIRTPMTAILGYTELMEDPNQDEERKRSYLRIINSSASALLDLIDDILDLSKIEAGHMRVSKSPYATVQGLREIVNLFAGQAEKKGLRLELLLADDLPPAVETDGLRFRQILLNIIGNSIKFTDSGYIKIRADLRIDNYGKRWLDVTVEDTGTGIDPSLQKELFQPFTHLEATTTRASGGAGLGLHLAGRLAVALGGSVCLQESIPGRGSIFLASIPALVVAKPVETGPDPELAARQSLPADGLEGVRILVVEDQPELADMYAFVLQRAGAVVDIADNGRVGAEKAADGQYNTILMDMQLPELDGFSATKLLRDGGCKVPIIALTAYARSGDRERCLECGCNEHLAKPVDFARLVETVARLKV